MKKILIFFLFLFICPPVFADGMFGVYDHEAWSFYPENQQLAAIHYDDYKENLLLSITTDKDLKGDKAVWIFPVPARPENVKIDMIDEFPRFYGLDVDYRYKNAVMAVSGWMMGYATAPVGLLYGYPLYRFFMLRSGPPTLGAGGGISDEEYVTVYQQVERYGVTTELVTAQDSESLSRHLAAKGMVLPDTSIKIFDDYIGKDYSFVVTYISNISEFRTHPGKYSDNVISTFVSFPAERIFFPLKPTSVYGGRQVPVTLYITEHVTPRIYPDIRSGTEIQYFSGEAYIFNESQNSLFFDGFNTENSLPYAKINYTRIRINSPSSAFTDDLWIDNIPPPPDTIKSYIQPHLVILGIVTYIIFSMVASLLAGIIWFRKHPVSVKKLLVHGLWNCLTMAGFVAATKKLLKNETNEKIAPFILLFYLVFAGLLSTTVLILVPSLGKYVAYSWALAIIGPAISGIYPSFITINPDYFIPGLLPFVFGFIHMVFLCLFTWSLCNWLDGDKRNLLPSGNSTGFELSVYSLLKYSCLILTAFFMGFALTFAYHRRIFDSIWPIWMMILVCLGMLVINAAFIYSLRITGYIFDRMHSWKRT